MGMKHPVVPSVFTLEFGDGFDTEVPVECLESPPDAWGFLGKECFRIAHNSPRRVRAIGGRQPAIRWKKSSEGFLRQSSLLELGRQEASHGRTDSRPTMSGEKLVR